MLQKPAAADDSSRILAVLQTRHKTGRRSANDQSAASQLSSRVPLALPVQSKSSSQRNMHWRSQWHRTPIPNCDDSIVSPRTVSRIALIQRMTRNGPGHWRESTDPMQLRTTLLPVLVALGVCGLSAWAVRSPLDLRPAETVSSPATDNLATVVSEVDQAFAQRWAAAGLTPAANCRERPGRVPATVPRSPWNDSVSGRNPGVRVGPQSGTAGAMDGGDARRPAVRRLLRRAPRPCVRRRR